MAFKGGNSIEILEDFMLAFDWLAYLKSAGTGSCCSFTPSIFNKTQFSNHASYNSRIAPDLPPSLASFRHTISSRASPREMNLNPQDKQ